ncbi:GNAT family N-acetyltransferase [Chitinophaga solisilvae]|uniref:GNAT family N-acetyltransferase n=1 Tax=Chitinophaga solisilvae TaxID=1233460 RepID=A0A3S1B0E1_9BACT|nr:GNAT family N-acetyltransferase [Chitinophaga solisilvae]NSL85246.1 GNAT family N-acetyltransferase [Chitinophaga solisilvae]
MEVIQATEMHTNEVAVLFDAYRSFYDQAPDFKGALAFVSERIKQKDSIIYVVLEGEEIIGFTQLYPIFTSIGMKRGWLLNDLYVLEEHRGKGAGSALLDAAAALGRSTGAAWVMLQTYIANREAQKLYEAKGFKKDVHSYYYYQSL